MQYESTILGGGKTNAFTATEATCYQFVMMGQKNFERQLDIFANFFVDATMVKTGFRKILI